MPARLLSVLCLTLAAPAIGQAGTILCPLPPEGADPASQWTVDVQSGSLWRISDNTFLNYVVLPQIVSIRTPAHFRWDAGEGELTVRSRLSILAEPIAVGPESHYFGFSLSPSLEYWTPGRKTAFFVSAGGGFGLIDSRGVPGGQGQDFTRNWFAETGVRWYLRPTLALSASAFYQHWSNGGATDPNPGLDALGPMLGLTWHF